MSLYSRVRRLGGALVITGRADTEESLELTDAAETIWLSIDGRRTVQEIAARLAEQYDEEEDEVADDVVTFLEQLTERGLVEWPDGGPRQA
ncbi:PqqD family protein [Actinoplanes sp. NPDC020271]|uniref:PqqD family protein n=1 Tax=Actinoplanes sp. NPDC020271 TaxID=3363896 RepID=UPI00378C531C